MLVEVNLDAWGLTAQNYLSIVIYHEMRMNNVDEVTDKSMKSLKEIEKDKAHIAKAYNKNV